MSRARHNTEKKPVKRESGGGIKPKDEAPQDVYAGKDSPTVRDAEKHTIGKIDGKTAKKRLDRKCGGKASGGWPYSPAHKSGGAARGR